MRKPRVRLNEPVSRPRVRLSPPTEENLIAKFIRERGVTQCPPSAVEFVRDMYPIKDEEARIRCLEVEIEKDPDRMKKVKERRLRILKKTEAWVRLLQREGKPVPKQLHALALPWS